MTNWTTKLARWLIAIPGRALCLMAIHDWRGTYRHNNWKCSRCGKNA